MSGNETTAGETQTTDSIQVSDADGTITLRKLVSKGERLEIDRGDQSIKLDALLLEGLSWQSDGAAVDELLDAADAVAGDPVGDTTGNAGTGQTAPEADAISISNEYAHVSVRPVSTEAGEGIEVATPGRGTSIRLGPASLRALAGVTDTTVFSVWFRTPFGPEDTPVEGPL